MYWTQELIVRDGSRLPNEGGLLELRPQSEDGIKCKLIFARVQRIFLVGFSCFLFLFCFLGWLHSLSNFVILCILFLEETSMSYFPIKYHFGFDALLLDLDI